MEAAFLILVFYIYLPLLLGLISLYAKKRGFGHLSPLGFLFNRLKYAKIENKYFGFLLLIILVTAPAAAYAKYINSDGVIAKTIAITTLATLPITSVIFIFFSETVREIYKKYAFFFTAIITLSAAINYSMASSFAEGIINDLTGVRAGELPTALTRLTLIMTPVACVFTITAWSFVFYTITLFLPSNRRGRAGKSSPCSSLNTPTKIDHLADFTSGYAVALGFSMLAIAPLSIASLILSTNWADQKVREQLVSASFHIKSEVCGIENIKNAKIAYLESGKALIAIPDKKKSYIFDRVLCTQTWATADKLSTTYGAPEVSQP